MIDDLWGKVLWLLRKWEIPSLVSDHPTLKERYQGLIEAALKFALTIDNFDDLVDPHHLYDCCFGPEPSAFVLKKIAREEKTLAGNQGHCRGGDLLEPGSVSLDVIAERKLQWRASIYSRRLRAVSSPSQNCREQNVSGNIGAKERIVQGIGPWIWRELQAILGDPDPSVIVHVAFSLFIASLENNISVHSEQLNVEDESIAPLHRFLDDRTSIFGMN
uniref:RING-type E3 ubiquitin transferase n=1 Tax=Quercus lobata TaxID=97700 RepID=A0A7N2LXK1_QUELO